MAWDKPDVYEQPEKFGLELVGSMELAEPTYGFDLVVVWRDKETKRLYYGFDSGCSCPSPFEDYTDRTMLTPLTDTRQFKSIVEEHCIYNNEYYGRYDFKPKLVDLMAKVVK